VYVLSKFGGFDVLTLLWIVCLSIGVWMMLGAPVPKFRAKIAPLRPEVQAVIDLLKLDRDWNKTQHVWFHPAGVNVWVGNKDYGLDIKLGSHGRMDWATQSQGGGLRLDSRHRKAVWNTIEAIKQGRQIADADAAAKAVAKRVLEMYPDLRGG
jgi:hypothetical protein